MLKHLLKKSLRLDLPDRIVNFASTSDFEFALASRTEVPAAKIVELVQLSSAGLMQEATSIREVERRFVEVLAKSLEESGSIGYLMREMDAKLFSQDHDWRAIVTALNTQGREFDDFKKIALVKYMQYLGSRQDILRSIYANKRQDLVAESEPDPAASAALKSTVIFDVTRLAERDTPEASDSRLQRLPRGETVHLHLGDEEVLPLVLSRHPFTLRPGAPWRLLDDNGSEHPLAAGNNVIGRQPENDVVIDSGYRDVSRKHLMIDLPGDGSVRLTDLSSHGTFLPLARTIHEFA